MFTIGLLRKYLQALRIMGKMRTKRITIKTTNNYIYKVGNLASTGYFIYLWYRDYCRLRDEVREKRIKEAQSEVEVGMNLAAFLPGGFCYFISPYLGGYGLLAGFIGVGWCKGKLGRTPMTSIH